MGDVLLSKVLLVEGWFLGKLCVGCWLGESITGMACCKLALMR